MLPFRKQMSLDKLTANLQPMMSLDVVGDTNRLRWLGPVLQLPGHGDKQNNELGSDSDSSGAHDDSERSRALRSGRMDAIHTNDGSCITRS